MRIVESETFRDGDGGARVGVSIGGPGVSTSSRVVREIDCNLNQEIATQIQHAHVLDFVECVAERLLASHTAPGASDVGTLHVHAPERGDGPSTPLADSAVVRTPPHLSLRSMRPEYFGLRMVKINFAAPCAKISHSLRHFDIEPTRRTPSPARTRQITL